MVYLLIQVSSIKFWYYYLYVEYFDIKKSWCPVYYAFLMFARFFIYFALTTFQIIYLDEIFWSIQNHFFTFDSFPLLSFGFFFSLLFFSSLTFSLPPPPLPFLLSSPFFLSFFTNHLFYSVCIFRVVCLRGEVLLKAGLSWSLDQGPKM